ncbi:MAG: hypothetical protein PWQ77_495 [Kosmotogales bacterium]|nr:hypothetical protein [Kosmotogales bacterium]
MIISASRRTDIPAFYSRWFINRLERGYLKTRNPFNYNMVSTVPLNKNEVDCIVFWTKNPSPIIPYLRQLHDYPYYFLFTLNPYGQDIEKKLPPKDFLIKVFKKLSITAGKERVLWRYDPVVFTGKYSFEFHIENFKKYLKEIGDYTSTCIISFFDNYNKLKKRTQSFIFPDQTLKRKLIEEFSKMSSKYDLILKTCSETDDYSEYGVGKSACIDKNLIEKISGKMISVKKDKFQRKECLCSSSTDIGQYNSCGYECSYCYAIRSFSFSLSNLKKHDPNSDFLI